MLIILHGFFGQKESNISLGKYLCCNCGCKVILPDACLHGDSQSAEFAGKPKAEQAKHALVIIEQTSLRLQSLISHFRYAPNNDISHIGVIGQSMGAMVLSNFLVSPESNALNIAVFAMGSPIWRPAFERISQWMPELSSYYDASMLNTIEQIQPATRIRSMQDVPMYFQIGESDFLISSLECNKFISLYANTFPERLLPILKTYANVGHDHYNEKMILDAKQWLHKHFT